MVIHLEIWTNYTENWELSQCHLYHHWWHWRLPLWQPPMVMVMTKKLATWQLLVISACMGLCDDDSLASTSDWLRECFHKKYQLAADSRTSGFLAGVLCLVCPVARFTNAFSLIIQFNGNFIYWTDRCKFLHMPWQLCCHGMCKILYLCHHHELNYSEK